MIRQLRSWLGLGPSRADLRAEVALWKARCETANGDARAAYARAKAAEKTVRLIRNELHEQLNEPGRVDGCNKVRFHKQGEAGEWAAAIAGRTGEDPEVYQTYQCKLCPRSPLTMRRYWHVGHARSRDAQESKGAAQRRRRAEEGAAHRKGRLIEQRVDPEVLKQLQRLKNSR